MISSLDIPACSLSFVNVFKSPSESFPVVPNDLFIDPKVSANALVFKAGSCPKNPKVVILAEVLPISVSSFLTPRASL